MLYISGVSIFANLVLGILLFCMSYESKHSEKVETLPIETVES